MRISDYEILYDLPEGEYDGQGIDGIRTRTYRAGRSLEVMCHPIVHLSPEARRAAKERRTSPAMRKINNENTSRHIMRLAEANFTTEAVVVGGNYAYPREAYGFCDLEELKQEYAHRQLPWEMERVRMDVRNWIAKLRRRVVKAGGKPGNLKWMVRIEEGKDPPGVALPPKYHFHAIVEGPGLDKETVKALWEEGRYRHAHVDLLDLSDDGARRLSKYFCKQIYGGRWWSHSRNLKDPAPRVSDRSVSRRRAKQIAEDVARDGKAIFEKIYDGYRLVEIKVTFSDYVNGAYIYARLRKKEDDVPPWERARRRGKRT